MWREISKYKRNNINRNYENNKYQFKYFVGEYWRECNFCVENEMVHEDEVKIGVSCLMLCISIYRVKTSHFIAVRLPLGEK